ncbi:MAG TPA: MFS transporter [Xanthobacteraceae bacterium]|jgi:NNP family nitrate/nitrite transporter-like MFS transporter
MEAVENPVVEVDVTAEPPGNPRVLWISFLAFTLGFAVWGMFSALAPFLIKWYNFSPTQVLVLAAMEPFFAAAVSIPLGVMTDKFGGRTIFTLLLLSLTIPLFCGLFAQGYYSFLVLGTLLGLGGASFVVGNAHVSSWYPKSKQGTALGIFAMGNIGIAVGTMAVTFLITHVLGRSDGWDGWRLIFPIFGISTLLMAIIYWFFTSDSPHNQHKGGSLREIVGVYRSGVLVWLVTYLYWASFGTLTFFASAMPTYLLDQWHADAVRASMVYTPLLVVCVAITRPLGGWLADRFDPLRILGRLFGIMAVLALVMTMQISLHVELFAMYGLALLSGAAAAAVIKLIPVYFRQVGAVSGLAKAAGAACGFAMTATLAASKDLLGGYTFGFAIWALMNVAAFYIAFSRVGFRHAKPYIAAIPSSDAIEAIPVYSNIATTNSARSTLRA